MIHRILGVGYVGMGFNYIFNDKLTGIALKNDKKLTISLNQAAHLAVLLENKLEIVDRKNDLLTLKSVDNVIIKCRTEIGNDLGYIYV